MRSTGAPRDPRRRGVVAVLVCVLLTVMIGFAALTIDVGAIYNTRNDLQDAADAAALAAVSAYVSDDMAKVRADKSQSLGIGAVRNTARGRADAAAAINPTLATYSTVLHNSDITLGWLDPASSTSTLDTSVPAAQYNAVQVVALRTTGSENGSVGLYFSAIFGRSHTELGAAATAVYDDRASGIDASAGPSLLPFTVHENEYESDLAHGDDSFEWDADFETVNAEHDGIREINLYPHDGPPGNFGALNIGIPNQSTTGLRDQIENGVASEAFVAEIGTDQVVFYDEFGDPVTYSMSGNTGLSAAVEPSIELRVGEIVGFFIHDQFYEEGANGYYRIKKIVFGRVMDVFLQGNSHHRGIFIQPVNYNGPGVITSPEAPSSEGLLGKITLAR